MYFTSGVMNIVNVGPWGQCYKTFTAVIYHHSMVILSFCVIKLYNPGNYCGMAVNYHSILTLEKEELEVLCNLPWYCFITLAPGHSLCLKTNKYNFQFEEDTPDSHNYFRDLEGHQFEANHFSQH
jgi:hypothetical protein